MNIRRAAAIAALAFLLAPSSWADDETLRPSGEAKVDGRTWASFAGPGGMRVLASTPLPDYARPRLERTVAAVGAWTAITPTEIRAVYGEGTEGDDYLVLVSGVSAGGSDYVKNIPSGIRLRFSGALMYDFRVKSGDYFVRVRGVLMDDLSLASEIAKATDDPAGYIAERDPAWAAARLVELGATIESSDTAIESLRASLAAQFNRGFFGRPRPVSQAIVDLVKEMKRTDPGTDRAAAAVAAKQRGINASAKELDAVFSIWFGE
ncbi:MAG: hypothetical protein KKB59_11575 [Spirochaetes bacterium]|nr:hypothetical protein [Spirochaetota bacterium]